MLIGLVVFFSYSQSHSKLNVPEVTAGVGVQ
jgi:hypothetical protein